MTNEAWAPAVGRVSKEGNIRTLLLPSSEIQMLPVLSSVRSRGTFKPAGPPPRTEASKVCCPTTMEAARPAAGASLVSGKIKTRLNPASATYKLDAASTNKPWGAYSTCAEATLGWVDERNDGWPNTRTAVAPVPAPAENSSTRLLPASATKRSRLGPMAKPVGERRELSFTEAELALVKSG